MESVLELQQLEAKRSRRSALLMGSAALAGLALSRGALAQAAAITDNDILNFALNLEFLEGQYYTLATQGKTIDQVGGTISGVGTTGSVTVKANAAVAFTDPTLRDFAFETAQDERNHIAFIQGQLSTNAVAMPNIDLQASWNTLATTAGLPTPFDPFASETNFLLGAMALTDVGVTAYHGAAGLISSPAVLDAAAGILGTEAYHTGGIRGRIYAMGAAAQQASQKIAATRAQLDGTNNDDIGVGTSADGSSTIVNADANAIVFARTAAQVLSVVYGGKTGGGLFFPNGLNGTIK